MLKDRMMKEKLITHFNSNKSGYPEIEGFSRVDALEKFQNMGFPNAKMEKWQKSKIKQLLKPDYALLNEADDKLGGIEDSGMEDVFTLHSYNGVISGLHSTLEGVVYGNLKEAFERYPQLVSKHFNRYIKQDLNGLNALNSALFENGLFIYVPKNVQLDKAIFLMQQNRVSSPGFQQIRNLIIVETGASISLLQSDSSENDIPCFTNSVSEIFIGANAVFKWYREQDLRREEALVNAVFVNQERDSNSTVLNTSVNGKMIRNDVHVKMNGTGCSTAIFGLYLPVSGQQVDNQVFVEHAMPNCVSNELFKGVLDGNGSAVFNGHILVKQDAQKTNAYQTNRNIVLSDDASVFAKPFLEIYADDVKCSHGATIGQLDQEALFYLQSRGLSERTAKGFLIKAFVGEVTDKCDHEGFKALMEQKVQNKLNK